MTRFFTADLHFGHQRIIELCNRPFASVEEMDQALIDNWNYEVESDQDEIYILGDLAMCKIDDSLAKVAQLRGKKYLVPGNHDHVHPCYPQKAAKAEEMRRKYEDAGLTILGLEVDFLPASAAQEMISMPWKLCHFPVAGDHNAGDRYPEYRPTVSKGQWLIHGHVHDLWRVNGQQINVGVDMWNFGPVREDILHKLVALGPLLESFS